MKFEFNGVILDASKPVYLYCYTHKDPYWYSLVPSQVTNVKGSLTGPKKLSVYQLRFGSEAEKDGKQVRKVVSMILEDSHYREYELFASQGAFIGISAKACKSRYEEYIKKVEEEK